MKTSLLFSFLVVTLLLTACGTPQQSAPTPDVGFIQTSAASTVLANFTLTASVSTNTPLPALTEAPTTGPLETATQAPAASLAIGLSPTLEPGAATPTPQLCDYFGWDQATVDVTIPDGTQMTPGQTFVKTWKIKNIGICTWGAGYKWVFSSGDQMSGTAQPFNGVIGPGQEVEVSVQFKAPAKAGTYTSAWTMQNASGVRFFGTDTARKYIQKPLYVLIIVKL